ncbi:energy-coupling factor ABC transporter permease [Sulfurihydrogenibium sp.]|uniref:energy-coupling factor ABC transporter permease n=1 Tax=Sulfurihydrogenibium sp. TaxID=2053621 RepID=UPI00260B8FA1|nr:energy-coupling factor ABC transporter permease [Sulfurihydrogenibium sp.]
MHVPDGFIAPSVYIPAYIVDIGLLTYSLKSLKYKLNEDTLPLLSVLSALSFILMSITFPVLGGTSVHITGVALLSIVFGYWISFFSVSLILFLQAVLFGEGGITSFPINSLAIAFFGSIASAITFKVLNRFLKEDISAFFSGWLSINISAFLIAVVLGIQPIIAHDDNCNPLYFPFGLNITLSALVIPHIFAGFIEGFYTAIAYKILKKKRLFPYG